MKLTYTGKFTEGSYNDMEAGYPVFVDGDSLSDIVKQLLKDNGLSGNFCDNCRNPWPAIGTVSENKLIGKQVTITLEWSEDE